MIFKERIYLYAARSTELKRWITTGVIMLIIVAVWWWFVYSSWYRRYYTTSQEYDAVEQMIVRSASAAAGRDSQNTPEKVDIDTLLHAALRAGLSINTCSGEQQGNERTVTLIVQGTFDDMVAYLTESAHAPGWCYQQGEWTVLPHDEMRAVLTGLYTSLDQA